MSNNELCFSANGFLSVKSCFKSVARENFKIRCFGKSNVPLFAVSRNSGGERVFALLFERAGDAEKLFLRSAVKGDNIS